MLKCFLGVVLLIIVVIPLVMIVTYAVALYVDILMEYLREPMQSVVDYIKQ